MKFNFEKHKFSKRPETCLINEKKTCKNIDIIIL